MRETLVKVLLYSLSLRNFFDSHQELSNMAVKWMQVLSLHALPFLRTSTAKTEEPYFRNTNLIQVYAKLLNRTTTQTNATQQNKTLTKCAVLTPKSIRTGRMHSIAPKLDTLWQIVICAWRWRIVYTSVRVGIKWELMQFVVLVLCWPGPRVLHIWLGPKSYTYIYIFSHTRKNCCFTVCMKLTVKLYQTVFDILNR